VPVYILKIPKREDGSDQGIDDYLGGGGKLEDLPFEEFRPSIFAPPKDWPVLADQAFYGLAGRLTKTIMPNTEADPASILLLMLTAYGNVCGRGAHFVVEDSRHFMKLFVLLVGQSGKARKGTAQDRVNSLMYRVAPKWAKDRTFTGLNTGEGLTHLVRDRREKKEKDGDTEVLDEGVSDKRCFVEEPEFAGLLTTAKRDGNNLASQVRKAWDDAKLQNISKNSSEMATNSHVSIVAHTNRGELIEHLTHEKLGGGFINRFLPVLVRRSQALAEGGAKDMFTSKDLKELKKAIRFGSKERVVPFSSEVEEDYGVSAKELWYERYEDLSKGLPGLLGETIARSEAQTRRIATTYAALDLSESVKVDHLLAAYSVWDYVFESCKIMFAGKIGNALADEILDALRDAGPAGLTQTELHELVSRNKKVSQIRSALKLLEQEEWVFSRKDTPDGKGRPAIRWFVHEF
jgi:hypothetical protein